MRVPIDVQKKVAELGGRVLEEGASEVDIGEEGAEPADVVRLYVEEHLTQKQIAMRCGISQPTVGRRLVAAGALSRSPRRVVLDEIPEGATAEDRRKLVYVRDQLDSGRRDDRDVALLTAAYREVLRRYGPRAAASGALQLPSGPRRLRGAAP